ncbi:MAG: phytanoyl-CoA dioxygenase [Novosphingobium sp.]|nr:phytanoyl-CoA dioxygenase [Novosphingobium sp.]
MRSIETDPDTDGAVTALKAQGYCAIADLVEPSIVDALAADLAPHFEQAACSTGPFYGHDTKRFGGLLARSPHSAAFVQHPRIVAIVEAILGPWCDRIALNLTQAIELLPGSIEQVPHRDQDMWSGSRFVRPELGVEFLVNIMWPLTPYTEANGTTRIWPGSHRRQHELLIAPEEATGIDMLPGAALLFLGSTLHAGGANRTPLPRRGMIVSYTLGWLKPYELQWLAYPPEVARTFPTELASLVGYHIHRPNLGNVEGRCPSYLLTAPGDQSLGAIDALGPDQHALIAAYRAGEDPALLAQAAR